MTDHTPDVATDLALGAFRMVKEKLQIELDFTPDTLPILDHYLAGLRDENGAVDEKVMGVVAPCAGAYFGEVCRRSLAGLRWHVPKDDYQGWRIEGERVFVCFNPVGQAIEAMLGEAAPAWNAHFTLLPEQREVVDKSLEQTGGVREDDFYRLAVRHEVLEQTLVTLSRLAAEKGEGPSQFGSHVYASVLDGRASDVDA